MSNQTVDTEVKPYGYSVSIASLTVLIPALSISAWSMATLMMSSGCPEPLAWATSLGIDGAAIVSGLSAKDSAERSHSTLYAKALTWVFVALSVTVNALHAVTAHWNPGVRLLVGAFPAVAGLVFELLIQRTSRTARAKREPRRRTRQSAKVDYDIIMRHPGKVWAHRQAESLKRLEAVMSAPPAVPTAVPTAPIAVPTAVPTAPHGTQSDVPTADAYGAPVDAHIVNETATNATLDVHPFPMLAPANGANGQVTDTAPFDAVPLQPIMEPHVSHGATDVANALRSAEPPQWAGMTVRSAVERADRLYPGLTSVEMTRVLRELGIVTSDSAVRSARSRITARTANTFQGVMA